MTSIALSGIAQAASLLSWNLDFVTKTGGPANNVSSTSNDPDISAGVLSLGPGTTLATRNNAIANRLLGTSTTIGEAIANGSYWGTTLSAAEGFIFEVSNFSALVDMSGTDTTVELRSSVDSFASSLGSQVVVAGGSMDSLSFDLSSSLSGSYASVEFRLYMYNANSPGEYDTFTIGALNATDGLLDINFEGTTGSAGQRGTLFVVK